MIFHVCRFLEKQATVLRDIKRKLNTLSKQTSDDANSSNKSKPVDKAVLLFKSCMDIPSSDRLKIKPLQDFLTKLKLPIIPTLMYNSENSEISNETESKFDWIFSIVHMKRLTGIDKLIGFEVCMSCLEEISI